MYHELELEIKMGHKNYVIDVHIVQVVEINYAMIGVIIYTQLLWYSMPDAFLPSSAIVFMIVFAWVSC